MTDEKQETERRILREELVEIEGIIDRLGDVQYVIDENGSLQVLTAVRCKELRFKEPLQRIGDAKHFYNNFSFHGFLSDSVAGKQFWLRESYNQFEGENSKTLYAQRLTVRKDDGFLKRYWFVDVRKRDYSSRLARRIAQEKVQEEGR